MHEPALREHASAAIAGLAHHGIEERDAELEGPAPASGDEDKRRHPVA